MTLFRYIELAMIGDSVGMINGLYLLDAFPETLNIPKHVWNHTRVR